MAEFNFILQAVTAENHAEAIKTLLDLPEPTQILVSVGFVRTTGLDAIESKLAPQAAKAKFFVGIRNDITSIQAIQRLLSLKVELYAVDTGSRHVIFHPKLYLASNASSAIAIFGSANMTHGGLHNNIEASTRVTLDLVNRHADQKFLSSVFDAFDDMLAKHPKHVFKIRDEAHAMRIFKGGRLADESVKIAPAASGYISDGERDDLTPMKLRRVDLQNPKPAVAPAKEVAQKEILTSPKPGKSIKYLVWKSKRLSERDLNIPQAKNTNPTGSMGLKQGQYTNIDGRHYFHERVFSGLDWQRDAPGSKKLKTIAKFELVIKNINLGIFELIVTHDTNQNSASYRQHNIMTHLHWGEAKPLIAKVDLLGRHLYLYRQDSHPPEFMIEID